MTETVPTNPRNDTPATAAKPQSQADREPIVGIDLGTTNSLVAYCDEAGPRVLESAEGDRKSVV